MKSNKSSMINLSTFLFTSSYGAKKIPLKNPGFLFNQLNSCLNLIKWL